MDDHPVLFQFPFFKILMQQMYLFRTLFCIETDKFPVEAYIVIAVFYAFTGIKAESIQAPDQSVIAFLLIPFIRGFEFKRIIVRRPGAELKCIISFSPKRLSTSAGRRISYYFPLLSCLVLVCLPT